MSNKGNEKGSKVKVLLIALCLGIVVVLLLMDFNKKPLNETLSVSNVTVEDVFDGRLPGDKQTHEGIQFEKGSWDEILDKAKKEKKLVFVDFYTQWCGPCYNMATKVFTLYSVGAFYNSHFVSAKIDAETKEGRKLANKSEVRSYPTYVFINPETEEIVHRGGGNISADKFLLLGSMALNPETRSFHLEEEYKAGSTDPELLYNYIAYSAIRSNSKVVSEALGKYCKATGKDLSDKKVWNMFYSALHYTNNPFFEDFVANLPHYKELYGEKTVEDKLYNEYSRVYDLKTVKSAPEFKDKNLLVLRAEINDALRHDNINRAIKKSNELLGFIDQDTDKVCDLIEFISRDNLYRERSKVWSDKCLELSRIVAYNRSNRDDKYIHYIYCQQLEKKLARTGHALKAPKYGKQEYSMRPKDLKMKPRRK